MRPVASIIMPSYNRAHHICETLDSIRAQSLEAWECIVVDDGSTDDSLAIVTSYVQRDPRVKLMQRGREPKGAGTCRNIAVEHACGRYVMFLDTDDILAPFCLEHRVGVMEANPELDFSIFPMLLFHEKVEDAERLWNIDTGEDDIVRLLQLDPICPGTGTLWRRDSFVRLGMWNEYLSIWQDIELHLRAFTGPYRYVKRMDMKPDVYIRESVASLSRESYDSPEKLESRAYVVRAAVALLRECGKANLVPEVRHLCANVAFGAARAGQLDFARRLRTWGELEGVLGPVDSRRIRFAELCRLSRLDRIPAIRQMRDRMAGSSQPRRTLGTVKITR